MRDRRAVLSDGRLTIEAGSDGASILTTVEGWFEPGVRVDEVERIGHGSLVSRAEWDARAVLIGGHVSELTAGEVREWCRMVSAIAGPETSPVLHVADGGMTLSAEVVRKDKPRLAHSIEYGWVEWEMSLLAPDPHLYGPVKETHVGLAGDGVGLEFALFSRDGVLTFGDGVASSALLRNGGTAVAWPVYEVHGDLPSGFTLVQGGGLVEFVGAVRQGVPAVVDMGAGRVTVGGADRSYLLARAVWAGVEPGGLVIPELSAPQGSGRAVGRVRDTYI